MPLMPLEKRYWAFLGNLIAFSTTTKSETFRSNASMTVKIKISSVGAGRLN